jgi:competence protein ComEA
MRRLAPALAAVLAITTACSDRGKSAATGGCKGEWVEVAGAVSRPGVLCLGGKKPDVAAALEEAGADGDCVEKAPKIAVRAGDLMIVGTSCQVAQRRMTPQRMEAFGIPLDLNRADPTELEALPGIGPVLARRIAEDRLRRGRYLKVDELTRVDGIGPAILAKIKNRLIVKD